MHHHNAEDCSDCLTQADNASYDIDTCGTHTFSFQKKDRGIHSVWAQRVDELIEGGVLPAKVLRCLQKEATENTRPLLPHLSQIHNRKKTVFRATTNLSSQHTLTLYMKKRMVRNYIFLCWLISSYGCLFIRLISTILMLTH
jgi:hypothetical protein